MKKTKKRKAVEFQLSDKTLRSFRTLIAAFGSADNRYFEEVKRTKDRVSVRVSLSKKALVNLWRLAACHKIPFDRYLENFLTEEFLPELEEVVAEENKSRIVKFPVR
jgi:hypothetical protein